MMNITILGATGSIGRQTLDVIASSPEGQYRVFALTANRNTDLLFEQCQQFNPEYAVCVDADAASRLNIQLKDSGLSTEVLSGAGALVTVATDTSVDCVVAAIVGAAGLRSSLAAAAKGKRILLANKEALIMSGRLFMDTARANDAVILPVDSEHNALFQCMPTSYLPGAGRPKGVERLALTASGGPFLHRAMDTLATVTPEEAVAHPNWSMGAKISVDSATMMNKGLELIEASFLFDCSVSDIDVVIHPQSIIHGLVSMTDGSVLAEMGMPDMRCPISHCLGWPARLSVPVQRLDLVSLGELTFESPDMQRFPCLQFALDAAVAGQAAICALNAANEIAVDAFLNGKIGYLGIPETIDHVLGSLRVSEPDGLEAVLDIDAQARGIALEKCRQE